MNDINTQYCSLTKKELAQKIGVSTRTLRSWLNDKYYKELEAVGYYKTQRKLTPKQVAIIYNILVIVD